MSSTSRKSSQPSIATTVAFVSLGCVKNLVDSEKMLGLLAEERMLPAPDPEQADVLVVNTCAFIKDSKRESLSVIRDALEWKAAGDGRRVVVAGCLAQRYGEQVAADLPGVDAMIGTFERDRIAEAVRHAIRHPAPEPERSAATATKPRRGVIPLPLRSNQEARVAETQDDYAGWTTRSSVLARQEQQQAQAQQIPTPTAPSLARRRSRSSRGFWLGGDLTATGSDLARLRLTPPHYAYLRISEGCDKRCSFCIIPHIRGDLVSKPADDVLAEARELVADGARELIVVGQNTTSYRKDASETAASESHGIARLMTRLARDSGAELLRLMYVYPANFYNSLIDVMAGEERVAKYVDMPLQHINDRMLREMRRGVSKARIEKLVTTLREKVPGVVIRTTLIVGFPGETDAEFAEMVDFVRTHKFERVGVFAYSPEEGTPAASLPNQLPDDVKQARREALMLAAQEVAFAQADQLLNRRLSVTLDARADEAPAAVQAAIQTAEPKRRRKVTHEPDVWWIGRYYGQAPEVDSVVYVRESLRESGHNTPSSAREPLAEGRTLSVTVTGRADYDLLAEPAA